MSKIKFSNILTFMQLIEDGTLQISDGYRAKNEELGGAGPIFLRAGHVSDQSVDFAGVERFHESLTNRVASKMSRVGDAVLTTKGNSTGRVAFVSDRMPPFVYSPHLSYWRSLQPGRLHPRFLYYWSRSNEFASQLASMSRSTDMAPYLSLQDQRRLQITVPPIEHQALIARNLGTLDDKIDLNRRMGATLEATARAIFKAWFVDFEPVRAKADGGRLFPGMPQAVFDALPDRLADSPLGPIPEGWTIAPMGEVVEAAKGLSYKGSGLVKDVEAQSEAMPLHNLNSVYEGGGYKEEGIKYYVGDYKPRHLLSPGDLIVANTEQGFEYRLIGFPAIVPERFGPRGLFTHHIYRLTPKHGNGVGRLYLYHALMSGRVREEVCGSTNGTTVNMLAVDGLQRPRLCIPDEAIGPAFERLAGSLHALGDSLRNESRKLAEVRDYLLPKLLSGRVRVGGVEE